MKELLKNKVIIYVGLALLLIGGSGFIVSNNDNNVETGSKVTSSETKKAQTIVSNADGTVISYNGEAGKTALVILKTGAEVITKDSSFGEYVTSINGVQQTDKKFWMFYVNDKQANVGASDYITKEGDHVEWKLEG